MSFKTTLSLLIMALALGAYIFFNERYSDSTADRLAAARMALRFEPEDIIHLRIDTPSGLFVLDKTNSQWRLSHPVQAAAEGGTVMRILDTLAGLRRSEIITAEQQRTLRLDPTTYGFTPPRARLTLRDDRNTVVMLIGRDAPGGHELYLKREDLDEIIVTSRELLNTLPLSVLDLRERRLFGVQPGRVNRIEWQHRDHAIHFSKNTEDQWRMDRPVSARASNNAVRQWLDRLYNLRVFEFISDSVAVGSLYGFDEPIVQLGIYTDNRTIPQTLKIGRAADIDQTAYYATMVGQDTVFTVEADDVNWLMSDLSGLRDLRLLTITAPEIFSIHISDADQHLHLSKNTQNVWEVTSPKRFQADDMKVGRLLSTWTGARVEAFIDPPLVDTNAYGLTPNSRTIRFSRLSPSSPTPTERETTFLIGTTNQNNSIYISPSPPAYAMLLPGKLLDDVSVKPLDYRHPVMLAIDAGSVRRIVQRIGEREFSVERTNMMFRAITPRDIPDTGAIDRLLTAISRLAVQEFIEEDPRDLARYGLRDPSEQLIIGLSGTVGINRVLFFGNTSLDGGVYAMVQGTDVVFTLPDELVNDLLHPVANPLSPAEPPVSTSSP